MSARIISTVGRAIDVIVAGRLVSHLRFAAGVCVLAAGLLMGSAGGAVAVADPDSSGSAAPGDGGTNASGQGSTTARSPVGNVTGTLRETIQRVTSTLGSGRQPGQQPSTGAKSPKEEPGGTTPRTRSKTWASSSGSQCGAGSQCGGAGSRCGGAGSRCGGAGSRCGGAGSRCGGAGSRCGGAGSRCGGAGSRCGRRSRRGSRCWAAPVPNLVGPVSDVIAPVQDMLTSVAGAVVPLTQLQSDLSSFLLGIAGVEPVEGGLRGIDGAGLSATAGASVASQLRLVRPLSGVPGVPVAGNTGTATLGGIAASIFGAMSEAGRASSLPGMAPPAPNGAIPMGVRSFLRHAVRDLPVAVSVAALAAVALPGVGGLVILTLAGVRIGYRQAKAGFVLRTAGIARFAGPGPLGVVRSGSLVVVRPRGLRVVRATGRAGRSAGSRARWAGPTPPRTPLSRHSAPGSIAA